MSAAAALSGRRTLADFMADEACSGQPLHASMDSDDDRAYRDTMGRPFRRLPDSQLEVSQLYGKPGRINGDPEGIEKALRTFLIDNLSLEQAKEFEEELKAGPCLIWKPGVCYLWTELSTDGVRWQDEIRALTQAELRRV